MTVLDENVLAAKPAAEVAPAPLIVFAGGGTGGHLYPALAVAGALRALIGGARFVFFGTDRAIDHRVLSAAGEELVVQEVAPMPTRPWRWPAFLKAWRASCRRCRAYFSAHQPAAVIGTGGFASGPAVCEAARARIPTALLNPDVLPGRANRWLAPRVDRVFVQWEEAAIHFSPKVTVETTGCPIRAAFAGADRRAALEWFGLAAERKTLLVTGASLGARSINEALIRLAPDLARLDGWQVLHLTGAHDLSAVRIAYARAGVAAACVEHTERMGEALVLADLVVSRAGASSLAELTALGKASILVPYPHHRDLHQQANAEVLVSRRAARLCRDRVDAVQTARALGADLTELMTDERVRRHLEANAARAGAPQAAEVVAQKVVDLIGKRAASGRGQSMEKTARAGR